MNIMQNDKKIQSGRLQIILLKDIGNSVIQNDINDQSIMNVLKAL